LRVVVERLPGSHEVTTDHISGQLAQGPQLRTDLAVEQGQVGVFRGCRMTVDGEGAFGALRTRILPST
jgi:hypothetical protein